ncbi:hypothetical protein [Flavobacterium sp. 3HN19-14]|uniref:hypothetical protein n=1 Tax=Flavobacterium sp. 3HN19-14 TaxID=3448133 RepID=UPI003EDE89AE
MNYKNYSDKDLMDAYNTMIDYSGKADNNILNEIENRGGLTKFLADIEFEKTHQTEIGRISKEVYDLTKDYSDLEFIKQFVASEILTKDQLENLVTNKFNESQAYINDKKITSTTITGSIIGLFLGTVLGSIFFIISIFIFKRIFYFSLIGSYIICYFSIKLITKQSRNNPVIFIASLLGTVGSLILGIYFTRN